jgi:tetratricopeptide (TPR) repeat protein
MKVSACLLPLLLAISAAAQTTSSHAMPASAPDPSEKLGVVNFPVSCAPATQPQFNRGVALLHDFWYEEARPQFEQIAKANPACAMAYWGIAMSDFHQIWDRPSDAAMKEGWAQMQKAQAAPATTDRERAYIAALSDFFRPGKQNYQARIDAYSAAMGKLYAQYPSDVDAAAFYALSLLAAEKPDDTSLAAEKQAMAVLTPLLPKYPGHPGLVHYIIHSCDNPAMASEGLDAANRYGEVAPSGAHAVHMSGHIYARLGMWPEDVNSQLGSIAAAEAADAKGKSGLMDEPHSYDFLLYAYLQSGQDANARTAIQRSSAAIDRIAAMPGMGSGFMEGMVPNYRAKLPTFYALEMRDWKSAAALEPATGAPPDIAMLTYWARTIAAARLHQPEQAQANLARFDALVAAVRKGPHAYYVEGTRVKIVRSEMLGWVAFAQGKNDDALAHMRDAAELQDKVGQAEVDIPAREMLADILLELHQPQQALVEYETSLKLSPNRFNGLYNAGQAAEAAGDKAKAEHYYAALLQSTGNGSQSARPEFAHIKSFVSSTQVAAR